MSDAQTADPTHARLFELIRQGNLAAQTRQRLHRTRKAEQATPPQWSPTDLAATLSAA